jgi:hypothetical protein
MNINRRQFYCVEASCGVGERYAWDRGTAGTLKFKVNQATFGIKNADNVYLNIAYVHDGTIQTLFTVKEAKRILKLREL